MPDAPDWVPVETAVGATTAAVQAVDADVLLVKASTDLIQTKVDNVATQVTTVQTKVDAVKASTDLIQTVTNPKLDAVKASTDTIQTKVDAVQASVNALAGGQGTAAQAAVLQARSSQFADGIAHNVLAATLLKQHVVTRVVFYWDLQAPVTTPRGHIVVFLQHAGGAAIAYITLSPEQPTVALDIPAGASVGPVNAAVTITGIPVKETQNTRVGVNLYYYNQ